MIHKKALEVHGILKLWHSKYSDNIKRIRTLALTGVLIKAEIKHSLIWIKIFIIECRLKVFFTYYK